MDEKHQRELDKYKDKIKYLLLKIDSLESDC